MTPSVVGFVGLGAMGGPMASRIVAAGFEVVGFDAAGTDARLPAGACALGGVEDVALAADTVLLSLPDGAAVLSVVAAIAAVIEPRVAVVVDLSTTGPVAAVEAAAALAAAGIAYVDGPVSGGVAGAKRGTISLMYAGPTHVLDAHRRLFDSFAGNVFHVGTRPGQGQAMKLLNNFVSATSLGSTSEALAFGEAHGLALADMVEVLNASSGRTTASDDKFPNRVLTGSYDSGFRTGLMAKDVRLYIDTLERVGTPGTVGRAVDDLWRRADAAMPGSDFTRIWSFVRDHGATGPVRLRPVRLDDEAEFRTAHRLLGAEGFAFGLGYDDAMPWAGYVAMLDAHRHGRDLPEGFVPSTFLVAVVDGQIVGRTSIRHALNEYLAREGGHIGYGVLPQHRRRGHATDILRQSLVLARSVGVDRALLTCDDDNAGSIAVIERCGGRLESVIEATDGSLRRRYWIE